LSIRWPLALWDAAFHDDARFVGDASQEPQWNRGAYLVQGLAHCGTCHTPRGWFFEEKDLRGHSNLYLSGGELADGSSPINLRGNSGDGLGRWSIADIATLLKAGRSEHSAATGAMADAVDHSTQYMTDQDVTAIAIYLKSLSAAPERGRASFAASDSTIGSIMAGSERSPGGRIYLDSCAACHRLSGSGQNLTFPTLAGNSSVLSSDPSSLINVILQGARAPSTAAAPTGLTMPGFGWRYSDADVAALATFVRSSWGNNAPPVAAASVARIRDQLGIGRPDHCVAVMKLIGQIACGVVLGWLVIRGIELITAAAASPQLAHRTSTHEPLPTPSVPHAAIQAAPLQQPPPVQLPPTDTTPPPPADTRHWSVTTVDGKTYSGTGPAPPGGLPAKP